MKNLLNIFFLISTVCFALSCDKEDPEIPIIDPPVIDTSTNAVGVQPLDINIQGFDFLEKMQGHWVGSNQAITGNYDWFAFDYRAISPSHIHGIFEGGTLGNLLTSFFVADFKGTRTIMARNGGLLNGIYRSSYFVLDSVSYSGNGDFYRLVDAEGGTKTMWMELRFTADSLFFNAYTSRLGLFFPPSRHMTFKAKREHTELSQAAAAAVGFPKNEPAWDFSEGFNQDYLQAEPGAKSATFLARDETVSKDVFTLAAESGDPFVIDQHPYLAYLQIDIVRNPAIEGKTLWIHLSKDPLTDSNGYFTGLEAFNSVLLFPELIGTQNEFLITYLHPGDYYVNITADIDGDGTISDGDITHSLQAIKIKPEGQHQISIDNITVEN